MLDQGNAQLSAVGFYNPTMGQRPLDEFFGGASAEGGALPYEVRWDAELDGGDGGWKIFLPTSHLLAYNGSYVTHTGVTAMSGGWHSLDDVQRSSTHVWLVLSVVDLTGVCTAEFSPTQGQSVTGTTVHNICIAEISYTAPAAAGDQPTVVVKQSLVGALHFNSDNDDFLHPFEVRWSASENNGAGAWVIWLPDSARLVFYDRAWRTITGITAATTLPAGWYTMDAIRAQDRTVYLSCFDSRSTTYGYVQVSITRADTQGAMGGEYFFCAKVAEMTVDETTGAKRVKQFVDSTVEISNGNGGGSVTLDDVSTDFNSGGEVQIKDWDTGTPASSTTIAQDIHDGNTTAQGTVVERTTGGVLQYKKPGTLAQLLGSSVSLSSQKILTGLRWDTTYHTLVISSANITVVNGVITAWAANNDETIPTTNISSIIN